MCEHHDVIGEPCMRSTKRVAARRGSLGLTNPRWSERERARSARPRLVSFPAFLMVEQTANPADAADAIVPSGPAIAILEREAPPSVFVTDLMMPNIGALLPPEHVVLHRRCASVDV